MRMFTKAAILAVALAVPAAVFAQGSTPKKGAAATKSVASHTTAGSVKSISDTSLVITKGTGAKAKDETFVVNASTKKDGDIAAGTKVTVAYTTEGTTMTATSIKAAKAPAAKGGKSKTK
jgi:hypothetical protein